MRRTKLKNIILVGYMGCGKSTIGYQLAKRMSFQLIDTDSYIEEQEKRKITDIFATDGEAYFRDRETRAIKELIEKYGSKKEQSIVLATGGGLPLRKENRELLKQLGEVFLLKASVETTYNRVKGDTGRPLLQCDDPKKKIEEMLDARKSAYEDAADHVIVVDNKEKYVIIDEILEILK